MSRLKGITVVATADVKTVSKPWGWEKWMAAGKPEFPYAFKIIHIRAPHKTSLQFHQRKQETSYIKDGTALLHYSDEPIDLPRFERNEYTKSEIAEIIGNIKTRELPPGSIYHALPGYIHRIEAVAEDITMIEVSSVELDDVSRIHDDYGRPHGKV